MRRWIPLIILLLIWWGSRIMALDSLPLHNDEGLHLFRAEQVWHGHPFWEISDGKIINAWPIAFLRPQTSPIYAGRMATLLVVMPGFAAGYALVRRLYGREHGERAAIIAGMLWICSPYMFFYERLALSDAEAGSLIVVTAWASVVLAHRGRKIDAVWTGSALALAVLFKFTAAPFALIVPLIVLTYGNVPWRQRIINLIIIGAVGAACFAVPLLYLAAKGDSFGIALEWVKSSSGTNTSFSTNIQRLWDQLTGYGIIAWTIMLLFGLVLLVVFSVYMHWQHRPNGQIGWVLAVGLLIPILTMAALGNDIQPRHYVAGLPLALILAGAGLGAFWAWNGKTDKADYLLFAVLVIMLPLRFVSFLHYAYDHPDRLQLPTLDDHQFVLDHSAGFGLREAVEAFPKTIGQPGVPVIASMFPDSCKRANYYDTHDYHMACPTAPGLPEIQAALQTTGVVYVLAEQPPIGLDATESGLNAELIAVYPRPYRHHEQSAPVLLWRITGG